MCEAHSRFHGVAVDRVKATGLPSRPALQYDNILMIKRHNIDIPQGDATTVSRPGPA